MANIKQTDATGIVNARHEVPNDAVQYGALAMTTPGDTTRASTAEVLKLASGGVALAARCTGDVAGPQRGNSCRREGQCRHRDLKVLGELR